MGISKPMLRIQANQVQKVIDFFTPILFIETSILDLKRLTQTSEYRITGVHGRVRVLKNHLHMTPLPAHLLVGQL